MQIFDLRLLDTVVVSVATPNAPPAVNKKHNLEASIILSAPFAVGFLGVILVFLNVPGCSFSDTFFGHDQIGTSQHPNRGKKIPAFIIKVTKITFVE